MKPIRLKFSGLNSYRTQQMVDFESLGANGLFGIFGPTGSGKSSILDAITLALYGDVDRASNNTRGIINQLEKSLEVSFEFELGGERYLVERRYERNPKDPDAALAKQARFRKITLAGEDVLASRPQEVTAKVEAILGIGKDEFSKAVVLPQGKFDQFLRLTGGDRAAMLEHLFNLEQYGERLATKVKNEASNCLKQLERLEGEEQGLGDCSEEALSRAVLELKNKNDEFSGAQQAFEAIDKSYHEMEAVRELFLKRETALNKLCRLIEEQEAMNTKESRLNSAERAEPLRELIARHKKLERNIAEQSISRQKMVETHAAAVKNHEEAEKALEKAERDYREQYPQLQARKAEYKIAREKQEKLKDIQKIVAEKLHELEVLHRKIAGITQEIAASKRASEDAQAALDQMQQERAKLSVNPQEKEAVEKALNLLVRLEETEKRYRESQDLYTRRQSQNDGRWAAIIKKVQEMSPDKTVTGGTDLEKYTKSFLNQAEKDLEEARNRQKQALIANSAAELAKELHDGEPCPVCGSREHPFPAKATGDLGMIESEIKSLEERLRKVRDWEGQLIKIWHDWSVNESLVNEARDHTESIAQELRAISAEFDEVRGEYDRERLRSRKQEFIDFEKQLHEFEGKWEKLRKTQVELMEGLQQLNSSLQDYKIKEASVQSDLANYQSQLGDITKELDQATGGKDLDDLIRDLVRTYEKLDQAVKDTKVKEGETRASMEKTAREIAALEATLKANREELALVKERLTIGLNEAGFADPAEAEAVLLETAERQAIRQQLEQYRQEVAVARNETDRLEREINNRPFEEALYEEVKAQREALFQDVERLKTEKTLAQNKVEELRKAQERWIELQKQKAALTKRKSLAEELGSLLRGRKFVSFLAQEQLRDMTLEASYQLGRLTGQRYALELSKEKDCEFVIRDDYNGGARRMINSLSGGEVFMTSLALALALSSKIQLRGKYPLGFFFLDEGFGSLDQEKLDKVMNALEKLHDKNRMVGVISHVREMKERLPKFLEVLPAGEDGSGSRIK